MTPWEQVYAADVAAVAELAATLTPAELAQRVPATPQWSVHDLLAHLAGGSVDALAGRMDGAPGPEWTGRHVAERADAPVEALVAELVATVDPVAAAGLVSGPRPALVFDRSVHLADLCEALGRPRPDEATWRPVLAAVAVRAEGVSDGVEVEDYELFRVLFSRRSRAQVAELFAGSSATAEQLDALGIFGPREDDQPRPADEPTG